MIIKMTSELEWFYAVTEKKGLKKYPWLARVGLHEFVPF
jgi:hypothetical protein